MRIEGKCCGDCGKCELLESGKVDMVPCVLDQIFNRVQRMERDVISMGRRVDALNETKKAINIAENNDVKRE